MGSNTSKTRNSRLLPEDAQTLYQAMKDFHEVLWKEGIEYVVEGGTLLGVVRHGGIIPWDDDIDVQVLKADEERLVTRAFPQLQDLGYDVVPIGFGYKVFPAAGKRIRKGIAWRFPFIDVFVTEFTDGVSHNQEKSWPHCYFTAQEYLPHSVYKFGPLHVTGPHDPIPYLNRCYGPNWRTVAESFYDHASERSRAKPLVFDLRENFESYARGTGLLVDRVVFYPTP